jgi:nucleotide-binding universal stress UspA family protein
MEKTMYKRILISTDGSKFAAKGLAHGLELAKALKLPVTVVTATEMWSTLAMAEQAQMRIANPIGKFEEVAAEAAQKILASAEKAAKKMRVACECVHVADRHPADAILATAKAKRCDLIVMASHGRRGIQRALLGSVASEVLGNSKASVLIVR